MSTPHMVPHWARFHILRIGRPNTVLMVNEDGTRVCCSLSPGSPPVKEHRKILEVKANGHCELCSSPLNGRGQVDHIRSVKAFADDASLSIYEAFRQCWEIANLRLICGPCNNERNRRIKTDRVAVVS
jgi:5-methylcytosine-specific restriction endonuclease McrA